MLSLPDFKEKQILFIIPQQGRKNKIKFSNENICFEVDGKIINQLSCHKTMAVFIIGDFSITTKLIQKCQQYAVSLFLLKHNFELYAEIISQAQGNYFLRSKQYLLKKSQELKIAKHIIKNKIYNQSVLLSKPMLYKKAKNKITQAKNHQELLGIEGSYTKNYFQSYFKDIGWYKRMPRAKVDIINVLLDIGYTFLFNFIDSLLSLYGFDNYKGIYHKLFFQRKSLVCDLIEPFRCLIDKQIVKSHNLKQINKKDFFTTNGKVFLSYQNQQKYLNIFAECIMKQKQSLFKYIRDFYYCILNDKNDYKQSLKFSLRSNYPFFKLK